MSTQAICATFNYVNAGDTRARNLPAAQGYGTSDSPWLSPSYGHAQMSAGDTMYLYGYLSTDTGYYKDEVYFGVDAGLKPIFIIGVSDEGCSPTWSPEEHAVFSYSNGGATTYFSISGIRFVRDSDSVVQSYIKVDPYCASPPSTMGCLINDCLFDTAPSSVWGYNTEGGSNNANILFAFDRSHTGSYKVSNNSFNGQHGIPAISVFQQVGMTTDATISVDHCSISDMGWSYGLLTNTASVGAGLSVNFLDCIISCDTLYMVSSDVAGPGTVTGATLSYTNCDTFGTLATLTDTKSYGTGTTGWDVAGFSVSNPLDVSVGNVGFRNDQDSAANYHTSLAATTASSTGGLIGVSWGYYPNTPTTESARRPRLTMSQWLQIIGAGF